MTWEGYESIIYVNQHSVLCQYNSFGCDVCANDRATTIDVSCAAEVKYNSLCDFSTTSISIYFNTQLVTALSTMPDALHSILRLFQCNKKERTAVLSGLDAVGKTTLLYKLKLGMVVQTVIPTIGLNVETIRCPSKLSRSKLTLTCWDVGGCNHPHINYLHRSFVKAAEVVLWLVDSTDRERIGESAEVLEDLCRDKSTPDREDRGIAPNVPILM